MIRSYFKIAVRNLVRYKAYSFINILGLSLGVSCCLLLALYIQDEMSYDKHHNRVEDLYRIVTVFTSDRGTSRSRTSSPPIAPAMKNEIPEVEFAVRALNPPGVARNLIRYEDKLFYEIDGLCADSNLFEVFSWKFLEGNPKKALSQPSSVVLSDRLAKKLFGSEPALDRSIQISQGGPSRLFKITGVYEEAGKSHIKANFITSMSSPGIGEYITKNPEAANEWAGNNFVPSYLKLVPGHNKEEVEKKMNEVLQRNGAAALKAMGMNKSLALEPVKDIYLKSDVGQAPRIIYTYIIGSIAIFILLIACINFMNLSTARATQRAGEIGIRKVMGAFRSSLIRQVLGEAMVIVFIAMLISIVLVQIALPFFNSVTGKEISFGTESILYFGLALAGITILTGLLAGSYPAFYLSSFQPAQVLKGKFSLGNSSGLLRKSLVVFQFMIAIILVCGMLMIGRQLNYMMEMDLGFESQAKIIIPLRTATAQKGYESLRKELEKIATVKAVSGTEYVPGNRIWSDMLFYSEGGSMDNTVQNQRNRVDNGYIELLNIKMLAGRSFTDNREVESKNRVIVNRASADKFGIEPEKLVGQKLYFDWQGEHFGFEVIGVMENFHQTSPKDNIPPTLFRMAESPEEFDYLIASVETGDFENTVNMIETEWKKLVQDTPFEFSFLDENIQSQFDTDRKFSRIITSFTLVAMLISCLGLYGLSSYMAERRFKEIGVRKVLGASITQVVTMMSTEFVKLVAIAFAISVPLAWYAMDVWLTGFAYRTPIDAGIFVYAGVAALGIALITVSFESIKAASANPVNALRSE